MNKGSSLTEVTHRHSPRTTPRICKPLFATKDENKSTGVGLSIFYGLVEMRGGEIWAESQPGEGVVLVVRLPFLGGRT